MPKVRTFTYRKAPTPRGLEKIEKGEMGLFEPDTYANFNTGILEQYLDERGRRVSFGERQWIWKQVSLGMILGTIFAIINQYVGLKVGMIVAGNWYLAYIIGLALRWRPSNVVIAANTSTGASATCTGFVFTFPAIYLLAYHVWYVGESGTRLISQATIPSVTVPLVACIIAGILGALYFIIFRRIWLIEDPLPVPGFEGSIKLMHIAHDLTRGALREAKRAIKLLASSAGICGFFTFLRDFPVTKMGEKYVYFQAHSTEVAPHPEASFLDSLFMQSAWYDRGDLIQPYATDVYTRTHIGFGLSPMMIAIGWFMKLRLALLLGAGTLLAWFVIVPLALTFSVPVYIPSEENFFAVTHSMFLAPLAGSTSALVAHAKVAIPMAIGAILGGGITALIKMAPVFKTATQDLLKIKGAERKDWVRGKGWYEWPLIHIPVMVVVTIVGVGIIFVAGGYPLVQSFALSTVLAIVTLFLGAIAVKVMGEVRTTPVSGTSFITLLLLVGLLTMIGTPPTLTLIMALLGTTVFGSAISLASDIVAEFKIGMYCGTRPYYLMRGQLLGILPGAVVAAIAAVVLSLGLAKGILPLHAPQAHAFAAFSQVIMGGKAPYSYLALGFGIGVFVEILTGMGTAFGLGMYLPLSVTLPIILGGGLRDLWEKKWLEPKAKREKWSEREKTMKLMDSYMVATGLIVGEALLGTIVAIYLVLPLFLGG